MITTIINSYSRKTYVSQIDNFKGILTDNMWRNSHLLVRNSSSRTKLCLSSQLFIAKRLSSDLTNDRDRDCLIYIYNSNDDPNLTDKRSNIFYLFNDNILATCFNCYPLDILEHDDVSKFKTYVLEVLEFEPNKTLNIIIDCHAVLGEQEETFLVINHQKMLQIKLLLKILGKICKSKINVFSKVCLIPVLSTRIYFQQAP